MKVQLKIQLVLARILPLLLLMQLSQSTLAGSPAQSSETTSPELKDFNVLHFPQTLSLGTLYIGMPKVVFHPGENGTIYPAAGWKRWANAYRDVKVPKGVYVRLAVPQRNHDALVALKDLKPDTMIQSLQLGGTDFTSSDWDNIRHFCDLRELVLSANDFSDQSLSNLKYFPKLEMLDLSRTYVTDAAMKPIAELKELHTLTIGNDKIDDAGLVMLANMPRLSRLNCDHCPVGNDGIKAVINRHMYGLVVRGTKANDETVKNLALKDPHGLNYLAISNCKVTDACIADLLKITSLKWLVIQDTPISLDGLHRLRRGMPKCKILAGESRQSQEYREMIDK